MRRKQFATSRCCFRSCSTAGLSTNFSDLARQFGKLAVDWMRASRSWELSPREMTFIGLSKSESIGKMRPISLSKARSFHSNGEETDGVSYSVRADRSLTSSSEGKSEGMNIWQLSSIHPLSAFVTSSTVPSCLARQRVSSACLASSASSSQWRSVSRGSPLTYGTWSLTQDDGKTVSSQSKISSVSSAEKRWLWSESLSGSVSSESDLSVVVAVGGPWSSAGTSGTQAAPAASVAAPAHLASPRRAAAPSTAPRAAGSSASSVIPPRAVGGGWAGSGSAP
mmetsp:Transcript_88222/g.244856  ORF Transcript_88222/g.244856 Transcript_88222/m.244856 type:complete len:281 (-) Transcript_88222:7-849(-)